jgi:hypothetical protein
MASRATVMSSACMIFPSVALQSPRQRWTRMGPVIGVGTTYLIEKNVLESDLGTVFYEARFDARFATMHPQQWHGEGECR